MRTFTTLHSLAELEGSEPEPPPIDAGTHRCTRCSQLAYRGRGDAFEAADALGRRTVIGCDRAGCDHTVLPERLAHIPKPTSPLRATSTCGKTGKIRYSSESLAESAARELSALSRKEGRRHAGKKLKLNIAYPCPSCRSWHLSSDTS